MFGSELTALAQEDPSVCAITAAMESGTGLTPFAKAHPERFFDVGIAEGHAVEGMESLSAVLADRLELLVDVVSSVANVLLGVGLLDLVLDLVTEQQVVERREHDVLPVNI